MISPASDDLELESCFNIKQLHSTERSDTVSSANPDPEAGSPDPSLESFSFFEILTSSMGNFLYHIPLFHTSLFY